MPCSLASVVFAALFAAATAAQSPAANSPAPAASGQNPVPQTDPAKTKKVWTNDNLSHANNAVSVVGDSNGGSKGKPANAKPADAQYIASVRKQLEKLNEQMADVDKQIKDLKNFSAGNPSSSSSGVKLNKKYDRDPVEVQIRELQGQKKELQAKTDALLDEARKRGVEPGQLR